MITFRVPVLGDEDAIGKCIYESADLSEMTDGTPQSLAEWLRICSAGEIRARVVSGERSMVAVQNGEVVGYIAFKRTNHLSLLFVRKDFAQRGIGRELFQRCSSGLSTITVNSSDLAVGFYEKMGFIATGERCQGNGAMVTPMAWSDGTT